MPLPTARRNPTKIEVRFTTAHPEDPATDIAARKVGEGAEPRATPQAG